MRSCFIAATFIARPRDPGRPVRRSVAFSWSALVRQALVWPAVLWFGLGCSSTLPAPESALHPATAFVEVPYPPPAALVEVVPQRPAAAKGSAVWVDGNWTWRGSYYVWQRGGWTVPSKGSSYATWQVYLAPDGRLLFATGAWYDALTHQLLRTPEVVAAARTPPNQYTSENQTAR